MLSSKLSAQRSYCRPTLIISSQARASCSPSSGVQGPPRPHRYPPLLPRDRAEEGSGVRGSGGFVARPGVPGNAGVPGNGGRVPAHRRAGSPLRSYRSRPPIYVRISGHLYCVRELYAEGVWRGCEGLRPPLRDGPRGHGRPGRRCTVTAITHQVPLSRGPPTSASDGRGDTQDRQQI